MGLLKSVGAGMKAILQKPRVERELDEELEGFVEASAEEKQRGGMAREEALRAARVEMGSRGAVKHHVWSSRWEGGLDGVLQDVRISVRMLLKTPGFTLVALLSLALGIGANTAIFTLIQQVMLRNLPVRAPEQLVTFGKSEGGGIAGGINLGQFGMFPWQFTREMEANPGPFQGIASFGSFSGKASIRLTDGAADDNSPAILAPVNLISGNYFQVMGAQALMGRTIVPQDDATPGSGAVAVVSHHFWEQSLSSDAHVLGKAIRINGTPFEVVGVMPKGFQGIKLEVEPTEVWTPVSMQSAVMLQPSFLTPDSGLYFLHMFGRLRGDAGKDAGTLKQAQAWLDQQIHARVKAEAGAKLTAAREQEINRETVPLISVTHGVSQTRRDYGDSLGILMIVVGVVLLIACANLANFLLARAATRQREFATRLALGSTRMRIVRQSLIETLLLSMTGGALGLGLAFAATRSLIAFVTHGREYTSMSSTPDWVVLGFTLAVSLLTGLLFGLAPALTSARTGAAESLSSNARTAQSSGGHGGRFWPKALVTAQVILSLTLLVGAGLFLRTLRNLQSEDYGFERTHVLLADFDAQLAGYKPSQTPGLHQQLMERVAALPGVRSVALAATPPISFGSWSSDVSIPGYTPAPKENMNSVLNRVTGQYFETVGIAIAKGRAIADSDGPTSPKVAVINEGLAKHLFPKGDAIGHTLTIGIDSVKGPWQIVGVARDTKLFGPRNEKTLQLTYIPIAQIEPFEPVEAVKPGEPVKPPVENQNRYAHMMLVRTTGDPAKMTGELRAAFRAVDPNLPVTSITTIREQVSQFMSHEELISSLTGMFALLALVLAAIGLYGVMSYNVVRRTNEIGIRLALGAPSPQVLWMVLKESLLLLAIGVGLGVPLTLAATRVVKEQLFGLSAFDPMTIGAAIVVVSGMTMLAAWLPARRASRVDPMVALRCD